MRIALMTDTYPPNLDGVSHLTASLAEELNKEHEVMVIALDEETRVDNGDIRVCRLESTALKSYPQYRYRIRPPYDRVHNELKAFQPDVVHTHVPLTTGRAAEVSARKLGVPLVSTFHTAMIDFIKEALDSGNLKVNPVTKFVLNRSLVKRALKGVVNKAAYPAYYAHFDKCDAVTSPSDSVTELLTSYGICPETIHKVPNFIETNPDRIPGQDFREKWDIDNFMVLHVGRLSWEKRIHKILETASRVEDATFVITSKGPLGDDLKKQARDMNLQNVVFTGFIPYDELYGAYEACDTFLAASPYETFNISAAQSLAFGKPIIGLNRMGLTESISHGENGFMVDLDSNEVDNYVKYIRQLQQDSRLKRQMGRNAKSISKRFRKDRVVNKFVDVYTSAEVNGKGARKHVLSVPVIFSLLKVARV